MIRYNPGLEDIRYVCQRLRRKAREELEMQDILPIDFGVWIDRSQGFKWAVYHNGRPAALVGAIPMHRGVYTLFGTGTDDWIKCWRLVTLVSKRDMMTAVLDAGAHRAQCLSPASHADTHKWLRFLGASHEVSLPQWGVNGEDFIMFSWLKE